MALPSIPEMLQQSVPPLDSRGGDSTLPPLLSRQWWLWFSGLRDGISGLVDSVSAIKQNFIITDTRANRANYAPANFAGSVYIESDTGLTYASNGLAWAYQSGAYSRTQAQLAALIATLTASDVGMRIYVSDFAHMLWCTAATAVGWAPEDPRDAGALGLFDVAPGTGWALLDGSGNIAILKSDGTTRNNANAAAMNANVYPRAAAAFNGAITAATVPTISAPTFTGTPQTWTQVFSTAGGNSGMLGPNPYTPAGTVSAPTATLPGDPVKHNDWLPYIRK